MNRSTAISSGGAQIGAPASLDQPVTVASALRRSVAWLRTQVQVGQDTARLMALDDRLLAEIGVSRDQVRRVVRHGLPAGKR
jgi:uncharacterized protein YjiS (DUF1127 family)